MGHVGHEYRLQASRVVGTLSFLLQLILLIHEVTNVSHNAIAAFKMTVIVEVGRSVDLVPS